MKETFTTVSDNRELVIVREFDAPRDLLWSVWNEKDHMEQWFGPRGFSTRIDHLDFSEGGEMRLVMIGPDGTEYPSRGYFKEIDPPRKVVTRDDFGEGFDEIASMKGIDLPNAPMVTTAEFEDLGARSRLKLTIAHATAEDRKRHEDMGVIGGWNSSFDCLDEYLATL
ncbi:SRPBCC family protein [soil metagenome]